MRSLFIIALAMACRGSSSIPTDGQVDTGSMPELVEVGHEREFRGVWVATVWNINFPSSAKLGVDEQRSELRALVDAVDSVNGNAIVFQVRPEGDALYSSSLEPWSRVLSGQQGQDPGYDPLAELITLAHERNIEVHAWVNPYRAAVSAAAQRDDQHVAVRYPSEVVRYGDYLWMDPSSELLRAHTIAVCDEIASTYAIDGIHFDDYFYPYPSHGEFPDKSRYDGYLAAGGELSKGDWRRQNVHDLVRGVSEALEAHPHVRFGIGPFGIYRPGQPEGIRGLDAYDAIYADPLKWANEGWVDYLAPQLYWPSTQTAQAYEPLVQWWGENRGDAWIFPGNYLAKLDTTEAWTVDEFQTQVAMTRDARALGVRGNVMYHIGPFLTNQSDISRVFAESIWDEPVLTPPLRHAIGEVIEPPIVERTEETVSVAHERPESLRAWSVYRDESGAWVLDRVIPASAATIDLADGKWAISAVDRRGIESLGVVVHPSEH